VPQEHHFAEVLEPDEVDHVGDVGLEVDLRRGEMHSLAQAGEGDGVGVVALLPELTGDRPPAPAPEPTTTDQYVNGHPKRLLLRQQPGF
jgi:hypothetical protein